MLVSLWPTSCIWVRQVTGHTEVFILPHCQNKWPISLEWHPYIHGVPYHLHLWIRLGPGWSFVSSGLSATWPMSSLKATGNEESFSMLIEELIKGWVLMVSYWLCDLMMYIPEHFTYFRYFSKIDFICVCITLKEKPVRFMATLLLCWWDFLG